MKRAFTLAEVLITLGIIGIVAALTMPALIGNYRKKQTVTQLKKVYSALQQSILMSQNEYGDITDWDWSLNSYDFFMKYLAYNFTVLKNCGNKQGCWNSKGGYMPKGGVYNDNPSTSLWYKILLSDGTFVALQKQDNTHVHLTFDLNGEKYPNTYGKDIFIVTMTAKAFKDSWHNISAPGLYMFGHGLNENDLKLNSLGCSKNGSGLMCGEKILMDGWQIKKDYPW